MPRAVPLGGTAGFFDPRGRLDRDPAFRRIETVLPGAAAVAYADPRLVVAATPRTASLAAHDGCVLLEGRLENRRDLARRNGLAEDAPAAEVLRAAGAESALECLRGSFVAAAWDRAQRRGFLAVDQLGLRSTFYTALPDGTLAFASELVTLLGLLQSRPAPDPHGVTAWLLDHAVPHGSTLYEGVRRLCAARALELDESGWRERVYWQPRPKRPLRGSGAELAEQLWAQVVRAVGAKVDDGDRPAVILSGGVDSSVVAAAAVEAGRRPAAYSAVFPELPEVDESERIDAVVDALDLDAVELDLRPSGALALAFQYTDAWSLPLPGPGAALEQPLVERAGAEGATVILDGQAGDEVFGLSPYIVGERLRRGRLVSSYLLAASMLPPHVRGLSRARYAYRPWKIAGLQAAIPGPLHASLRHLRGRKRTLPEWLATPEGSFDPFAPDEWVWKRNGGPRWWAHRVYLTTQVRDLLGSEDYIRHRAWAVGAEARPPLLDLDLIDFSLRLPPSLGFGAVAPDRPLIREAMRRSLPDVVRLNRVKSNVAAFYYKTIAEADSGPIGRLLVDERAEVGEYADLQRVAELLRRPPGIGGPRWYDWFASIWRLATVEAWLQNEADPGFAARALAEPDVLATIRSDHRVRHRSADSSFFPPRTSASPM